MTFKSLGICESNAGVNIHGVLLSSPGVRLGSDATSPPNVSADVSPENVLEPESRQRSLPRGCPTVTPTGWETEPGGAGELDEGTWGRTGVDRSGLGLTSFPSTTGGCEGRWHRPGAPLPSAVAMPWEQDELWPPPEHFGPPRPLPGTEWTALGRLSAVATDADQGPVTYP